MEKITDLNIRMRNAMNENPLFSERVLVTGCGNNKPSLVLIGEAPGKDEEEQGKPFVGKAGKNLTNFLDILEIKREDIYITNLVKVRPYKPSPKTGKPVNRPPNKQEIEFFSPFMFEEIEIIKTHLVVTLGNFSLKAVMKDNNIKIGDVNGRLIDMVDFRVFPLYHPASIIYNQGLVHTYNQNLLGLKKVLKD